MLTNNGSLVSTNISIGTGGTFNVAGLSSTFALGASQTLAAGSGVGNLVGNANLSSGTVALNYTNGIVPLATIGALTFSTNTTLTVSNTSPTALAAGKYQIISTTGGISGALPTVTVTGSGIANGATTLLQTNNGNLYLIVAGQPTATNLTIVVPVGVNINLPISNLATNWSDPNGTNVTFAGVTTNSANGLPVTTNSTTILYTPTNVMTDTITYSIVDGYGATNVGTITVMAENQTLPPGFTLAAGSYLSPQTVSITNAEAGATIYYTTNGTTPTTSSASGSSPVTITLPGATNGFVIQALAGKAGEIISPVVSATYNTIVTPTWTNVLGGSWTNAVNWSNNVVANGSGVTADFSQLTLPANPETVTLDGAQTLGQLILGSVGNTNGWLVAPGNGGSLTLNNGTNTPVISVTNGVSTISAPISGTNGLVKNGTGTLTLTATNPLTGSVVISNGTLAVTSAGALAAISNIVINAGATFDASAVTNFTLGANQTLTALGTGTNIGSTAATLLGAPNGTVSLGSSAVILDYNGNSGSPALYVPQGTLVLNANPFTINTPAALGNGFYVIAQASNNITGTGPYTVNGTALAPGATGTITVVGNQLILTVVNPVLIYTNADPATNVFFGNTNVTGIIFEGTNATTVIGSPTNVTLTVNGSGITADPGAGPVTIGSTNAGSAVNVLVNGNQTWTNNSGSDVTVLNTISNAGTNPATLTLVGTNGFDLPGTIVDGNGPFGLVQDTTGTLTLGSSNTFSGGVIVDQGNVVTGNAASATNVNSAFGSNPVIILGDVNPNTNPASLNLGTGVLTNAVLLAGGTTGDLTIGANTNGTATFTGGVTGTNDLILASNPGGSLTVSGNPVNNTGSLAINGDGGTVTVNSTIGTNVSGVTIGAGTNVVTLAGTNLYTGTTTIDGTLALVGKGSIADSTNIVIDPGATFDVSGLNTPFALGTNQTLTAAGETGHIVGSTDLSSGQLVLNINSTNPIPALTIGNGTLTLPTNAPIQINNAGPAFTQGNYPLIATNANGVIAGSLPTFNIGGNGLAPGLTNSLQIINGQLYLVVKALPPVVQTMTIVATKGLSLKIALANVATNWSSASGSPVKLAGVTLSSTNGATLSTNSTFILYKSLVTVVDQINYTVTDTNGLIVAGLINIVPNNMVSGQVNSLTVTGGTAMVNFAGIPGFTYNVQVSTNLTSWSTVETTNAPANGLFQFIDNAAPTGSAFYRLMWSGN